MTDYNQNGTTLGSDGTIYANGSVTNNDPSTWLANNDWKSIMAAICGYSSGYEDPSITATLANPGQMQAVAQALYDAQQALSETAQNLTSLIQELTGSSDSWYGSWQGAAAQAAQDSITTFAKQVQLNADTVFTGQNGQEIAQQLADNAVNLQNAQNDVQAIDAYYATEAANSGITKMSDGLVPVSKDQTIVKMMTHDMYTVLQNLISAYNPTIDNVPSSLPGVSSPAVNDSGSLDPNSTGSSDPGGVTPPDLSGLGSSLSDGLNGLGSSLSNGLGGLGSSLSDGLGGLGSGLGSNLNGLNSGLSQFPGDTGTGDGLSQFPGDTGVGTGTDLSQFPGDTGSGTDTNGTFAPFTGNTGVGTGTGGTGNLPGTSDLNSENPSTWGNSPDTGVGDLGTGDTGGLNGLGGSGTGGTGDLSGLGGLGTGGTGDLSGLGNGGTGGTGGLSQYPGSTSTESGLPSSSLTGNGSGSLPNSLESSGAGNTSSGTGLGSSTGGMPYMPGMGGMGGAGGLGAGDNRSDASGLLDSQSAPWEGSANLGGGEVGGGAGTDAGGTGLDLPTEVGGTGGTEAGGAGLDLSSEAVTPSTGSGLGATDGMPYMPGMSGMGGLGGSGAGDNRSDASGLLEGESAPWEGQAGAGGEELASGAAEGGPGLDLPAQAVAESPEESPEESFVEGAAEGMPAEGMPYPAGAASAGSGGAAHRSDSSGLLDLESLVWEEGATGGERVGAGAPEHGAELTATATPATMDSPAFLAADSAEAPVTVDDTTGATAETDGNHLDFANLLSTAASGWVPVAEEAVTSVTEAAATVAVASSSVGKEAVPQTAQPSPAENRPKDRVTLPQRSQDHEDTSAWDVAGAAFVPVLWQVPGRGTDAGSEPAVEAAEFEVDEGKPPLTTWRPDRSGTAPRIVRSMADLRCVDGPVEEPEEAEETAEAEEQDEREQTPKGIADLLVQDQNTWGSWPHREASDVF